jgi:hypothetical protein
MDRTASESRERRNALRIRHTGVRPPLPFRQLLSHIDHTSLPPPY